MLGVNDKTRKCVVLLNESCCRYLFHMYFDFKKFEGQHCINNVLIFLLEETKSSR